MADKINAGKMSLDEIGALADKMFEDEEAKKKKEAKAQEAAARKKEEEGALAAGAKQGRAGLGIGTSRQLKSLEEEGY